MLQYAYHIIYNLILPYSIMIYCTGTDRSYTYP